MAEQTFHHRVREAILAAVRDGATTGPLLVEEADNLATAVITALYPNGYEPARAVLSDLLLTRQAQEDARNAYNRLPDDMCLAEYDEAVERIGETEKAHEAAWDRARSLLAGEAGNGN